MDFLTDAIAITALIVSGASLWQARKTRREIKRRNKEAAAQTRTSNAIAAEAALIAGAGRDRADEPKFDFPSNHLALNVDAAVMLFVYTEGPQIDATVEITVYNEFGGQGDRVRQRWQFEGLRPGSSYILDINLEDVGLRPRNAAIEVTSTETELTALGPREWRFTKAVTFPLDEMNRE